jgi:hypothetical protein
MSALTAHDRWLSSPVTDEPAQADVESIIDEMVAEPDCFDQWLTGCIPCPSSVAGLLSLILDRGLPRMTGDARDDSLRDAYDMRIQSVRADFAAWAQDRDVIGDAPIDMWVATNV